MITILTAFVGLEAFHFPPHALILAPSLVPYVHSRTLATETNRKLMDRYGEGYNSYSWHQVCVASPVPCILRLRGGVWRGWLTVLLTLSFCMGAAETTW